MLVVFQRATRSGDSSGEESIDFDASATVGDMLTAYERAYGLNRYRQHHAVVGADKTRLSMRVAKHLLSKYADNGGKLTVRVKDIGPQFDYKMVFVLEYLGPLLIMAALYTRPSFLFGTSAATAPYTRSALAGVVMWIIHYLKRELETLFVHKFSRPTMPLMNLFKNCSYYWSFAAIIGYNLCSPSYSASSDTELAAGVLIFAAGELYNLAVHLYLASLRPAKGDNQQRPAPGGPLFALVSCPNYTSECMSWIGFAVAVRLISVYIFALVGLVQMTQWALDKHRNYLKTDSNYKSLGRKAIIPFVL